MWQMRPGIITNRAALSGASGASAIDGLAGLTGAWSMSRDLLTAFIGNSRYTDVSGAVSELKDQSGNARDLTQGTAGNRPLVATAGPNSRTCADFVSSDSLAGAAISNFIANNAGYAVVSLIADTITTNSATVYANHAIICDGSGQIMGLFLRDTTGSPETIYAYNWDGSVDAASTASITPGTAYVVEWKHESGNVSVRVNGASWVDVASGNTTALTGTFTMGTSTGSSTTSLDGKVFEAAIFSTVPSSGNQDAIVADFKTHIGA